MTSAEIDTKALLAKALAALPEKTDLIYIDYRDEFSDENCAAIVAGNKDEAFDGWDFQEGQDHSVDMYLDEALPDEEEREEFRMSDEFDEFQQACYDRDESTPYQDILQNTGRKLVRFYIRNRKGERVAMEADSWKWEEAHIESEAKRLCKAAGLDYERNRDNFRELIAESSYGGVLCVIAYVEMRDVDKWVEHCLRDEDRARVKLTFTNPQLLAHDGWNGSGHDVQVDGDITIRFGRGALDLTHGVMALDARNVGTGYSWDETAGPYKPAYQCDPKVKLYKAKKGAKPDRPAPNAWPGR